MTKKKKNNIGKTVYYSMGVFQWFKCPHCKKMLILAPKEEKRALRKWRKAPFLTN